MRDTEENKNYRISSATLKSKNKDCLDEIEKCSNSFHYFTTVDTAEKILSGMSENYIYVSPINKMNDLHECELHRQTGNNVFGLCFCNSNIDNIPMWYLYAGISGQGARISITAKKMCSLIENLVYVYAVVDDRPARRLVRGIDFDLEYGWIFYRENENRIKYRDQYFSLTDSLYTFEKGNYLVKDLEWKYEKEFRLVFHVKGNPPERIAVPLDKKAIMRNGGLSVMLAPELRPKMNEKVEAEKYGKRFGIPAEKVKFSKLKIKMDLVSRNRYVIIERISDVLDTLKASDITPICEEMRKRFFCGKYKTKTEDLTHV